MLAGGWFRMVVGAWCVVLAWGMSVRGEPSPEALALVQQFVAEELGGDVEALARFDFAELEGHPLYGAPERVFDADDCNLSRAIFDVLYGDVFPGLSLATLGTGRAYRGDTLNTFHTLLGRPIEGQPGRFAGLEKYSPGERDRQRATSFHKTYHTLGNFVPLPNGSVERKTLNTYRGTHPVWRDAVPIFLENLRLALLGGGEADDMLARLVERNAEAFASFRGRDGLAELARRLDMDDYVDTTTGLPIGHYAPNAHFVSQSRADYLASVGRYLTVAPELIARRAERMLTRLRPWLEL